MMSSGDEIGSWYHTWCWGWCMHLELTLLFTCISHGRFMHESTLSLHHVETAIFAVKNTCCLSKALQHMSSHMATGYHLMTHRGRHPPLCTWHGYLVRAGLLFLWNSKDLNKWDQLPGFLQWNEWASLTESEAPSFVFVPIVSWLGTMCQLQKYECTQVLHLGHEDPLVLFESEPCIQSVPLSQ